MIKKFKHPPSIVRSVGILFLMLLWSFSIKAQTQFPYITWDQEVGCIEFDDNSQITDYGIRAELLEAMNGSKCLRFCENSSVNFKLEVSDLKSVKWQVSGGSLISSSNTNAVVQWGNYGSGALSVTITYTNGLSAVYNFCIEKIISPNAMFDFDSPEPNQMEFCTGSPISFKNLSNDGGGTAIVNYHWDFGDGNFSNASNPVHTYEYSGGYAVVLTVTNSCNCSSEYRKEVHIIDVKSIEITCASVTCEGSIETYTVNEACGGEWRVEGGHIIANNGNTIDVMWDAVNQDEGFGYVSYLSHCSCPFWNTIKIPIILHNGHIEGPNVVCQNGQGRFKLPQWPTTEFEWAINGNTNHPALVLTDQHNEIVINGGDLLPGNHHLSVHYRNTLIDNFNCMGDAGINFTVMPAIEIITDSNLIICQGTSKNFTTHNGSSLNWLVTLNNTAVHSSYGSTLNYTFNQAGTYVVGTNSTNCIDAPVVVDVIATPVLTGSISGPDYVCLNTPYTYKISENTPDVIYVWSVIGGTVIGNNTGIEASFNFTSPTATVSVVKQVIKDGVVCESSPKTYSVEQAVVNPIIINNSGLSHFCPSNIYSFTANLNGIVADHIEWSLSSASGNSNFGNIVEGINTSNVKVSFNEVSGGQYTGILTLKITKCNVVTTKTRTIDLLQMPVLTIAPIGNVCPGDSTITLTITSSPAVTGILKVGFGGDVPTGSYSFTSGVPITVNNGFKNNTNGNITQSISVQLEKPNGCSYIAVASRTATVFPSTKIDITPGYYFVVCPSNYTEIPLSATISTGITSSVSFQWLKNGSVISGATSSNYNIISPTPEGNYQVRVRDKNGCTVTSDIVLVNKKCSDDPGCTVTPYPNLQVTAKWDSCTVITSKVTYVGTPTSIKWEGSSSVTPTGANNTANGTFNVQTAGNHTVTAVLNYNGCVVTKSIQVIKNYEPKLKTSITCNPDGTYNVTLLNNSSIYDITEGVITYKYSGDGITGTPIGQSHTINNVAPGSHNYTITMSSSGKPTCSATITIILDPKPETLFTVDNPVCAESAISLTVPGTYNAANRYEWHFEGTYYVASGPTTLINIREPKSIDITLKVITPYGCTFQTPIAVKVDINKAGFNGDILPDPVNYCMGIPFALSFSPVGGTTVPIGAIWMRDNEEVGTGLTYTPTISGSYWPVLLDATGCKDYSMATKTRHVILRKPPHVSISGNTSLCAGERIKLTGIVTEADVEHRWFGASLPATYNTWVTGNTNMAINLSSLPAGSYTYTLEARYPNDTSCVSIVNTTVVVHPAVSPPTITYTLVNCAPYTLRLTTSGPTTGTYNWSNGKIGRSIEVPHGGAYSVTYTSTTGCTATNYIQAPHNPERALWVVPSGCYDICLTSGAYLLGPLGNYDGYRWTVDGNILQSGSNTFVHKQPITIMGDYQLFIDYSTCTFGSPIMNVTPDYNNCPSVPCNTDARITFLDNIPGGGFLYQVDIYNPYGVPVTMHLSSLGNFGTFSPATKTLNPGVNVFLVSYYPNSTYTPGGMDSFVIQMMDCHIELPMQMMSYSASPFGAKDSSMGLSVVLELTPNPASDTAIAHFDVGSNYKNAQNLLIYDVIGIQRAKHKLSGAKGELSIYVGDLAPGTYLVTLEADGKRIAERKLIKK